MKEVSSPCFLFFQSRWCRTFLSWKLITSKVIWHSCDNINSCIFFFLRLCKSEVSLWENSGERNMTFNKWCSPSDYTSSSLSQIAAEVVLVQCNIEKVLMVYHINDCSKNRPLFAASAERWISFFSIFFVWK